MKFAFLGAGKMAGAMVSGLTHSEFCAATDIVVSGRSKAALEAFSASTGVRTVSSNAAAVEEADVVFLCVKPGDAPAALSSALPGMKGRLLISVAAGLRTSGIEALLPASRVVRAMPNTAAAVRRSATAISGGASASAEDTALATRVFESLGQVFVVPEDQMDVVTALCGSGPAFLYLVIEAMIEGAVASGLPRKLARDLAVATLDGTAALASRTGDHPALLREAVTSPGGTTIAGLLALENAAVRAAFAAAIKAASARAKELAL